MKPDSFLVAVNDDRISLIDELELSKYAHKSSKPEQNKNKDAHSKVDHFSLNGLMEPLYDPYNLIRLLDLYTYHASCIDAVSTDVAGIDYDFLPVEDVEPSESEKELLTNLFSGFDINKELKQVMYDRRSIGYGALEIIRNDDGNLVSFKHIPSHRLRRHNDTKRAVYTNNNGERTWFKIYSPDSDRFSVNIRTGEIVPPGTLTPEECAGEVLWTNEYNAGSEYYGRPPIISALNSIDGDLSAVKFNNSFFRNYGMPKFAITVTGDFDDYTVAPDEPGYDVTQTLRYKISQQIKEIIKHPHSALCVTIPSTGVGDGKVDLKITPLAVNVEDGQFRLYRKDVREEVIHANQVDPSRLGIYDAGSLNGGNSDNTMASYKYGVIEPLKSEMESLINTVLINDLMISTFTFKLIDVSPVDYTKDVELAEFLFRNGAMTIRDLIENFGSKFGLNVMPGEDFMVDARYLNGKPLEQVWNSVNPLEGDRPSLVDSLETNTDEL